MSNRESPITPTVGRVVLVRGEAVAGYDPTTEYPGLVTKVWGQNCINVHAFNEQTGGKILTSVMFEDDVTEPVGYSAWRWMPYQVQQAAKAGA